MPEDYFGERVAERYDESAADMFEPAVVDPVVRTSAVLLGLRQLCLWIGRGEPGSRYRVRYRTGQLKELIGH